MNEDEVLFPTWDESYTKSSRPKGTKNLDSSPSLVQYMEDEFLLRLKTISINKAAVRGAFTQWKRNGISADQIREMIRVFTTDPQFSRGNGPAWKRFLYHRDTLLERTNTTESDSYWDEDDTPEPEFKWE